MSYRELALLPEVSLGSVSSVIKELAELNFVLVSGKEKILKNTSSLLERWIAAYHDVLRPRLLLKKMGFAKTDQNKNREKLSIQETKEVVLWGGEPAASLLSSIRSWKPIPQIITMKYMIHSPNW